VFVASDEGVPTASAERSGESVPQKRRAVSRRKMPHPDVPPKKSLMSKKRKTPHKKGPLMSLGGANGGGGLSVQSSSEGKREI